MVKNLIVTDIGGGSGCITVEEEFLGRTDNVNGITPSTDDGGDSGRIRVAKGTLPPGDATQRMAIRFRSPQDSKDPFDILLSEITKEVFQYRDPTDKRRPSSHFLAVFEEKLGSHSKAIWAMERLMNGYYHGRVIPITDTNALIRIFRADGSTDIGEKYIDLWEAGDSPIVRIDYVAAQTNDRGEHLKIEPVINPEAQKAIENCNILLLPPGTVKGSLWAITEIPGCYQSIHNSKAENFDIILNATTREDETPWEIIKYFAAHANRLFDHAYLNIPTFDLPESYIKDGHQFMPFNNEAVMKCKKFAKHVHAAPFVDCLGVFDPVTGRKEPTLRHNGKAVVDDILTHYQETTHINQKVFIAV